ncbi:ATP-dependent sacrificial sulfur transferase LarE [Veillonella denticariosi]|uniref:ATP-dependent sacrificial sulfur transferase LarE n=1 Tax=Veillonella denticariosi TaxID=419208 RepID=UPI0024924578|nr:ATP-dependent sacrificial sulfur transferase LarE [Veillonella denticariosi]
MELVDYLKRFERLAIAFSGGVDSSYLLYAAVKAGLTVQPYFVKSPFVPDFERFDALRLAVSLGVSVQEITVDPLKDERIVANPDNRCYYCKQHVFNAIIEAANHDGFHHVADGTNASDEYDDRPGMKAIQELRIYSPLRACGLTKSMIRNASREAGLFTWHKPAYACLATRFPVGQRITEDGLSKVEEAEGYLFSLGFSDFRVRLLGNIAKIQVPQSQLEKVLQYRELIIKQLSPLFDAVLLDLEVR